MHTIYDFENYPYSPRHGRYGGQAGDKDGIIYNKEYWMIKYAKSTRNMEGSSLPPYTLSALSEYIGSHIFSILGFEVHETLLGIRNKELVVACKDFQKTLGDLAEIRTLKNAANKQIKEIQEEQLPESATGDKVVLEELLLHFNKNPLLKIPGLQASFWKMAIVDILIGNNDRNNGNWGLLYNDIINQYEPAPIYDNGNSFNNKTSDERISDLLQKKDLNYITGERTIFTYQNKLLSAKKFLKLEIPELQKAILEFVPYIEEKREEIKSFIQEIPNTYKGLDIISEDRKNYYIFSIECRQKELLLPAYEFLKNKNQEIGENEIELD